MKHGKTGLVAKDVVEYQKYIELLYSDRELREELSKNARKYAYETFSLENMSIKWRHSETILFFFSRDKELERICECYDK